MLKLPEEESSYWRTSAGKPTYPRLAADLEVDVAIVGGGICGLSAAYLLKRSGKKVAVLEKAGIGSGTTGHTTGKVTSQHNLFYDRLKAKSGDAVAQDYANANQSAIVAIEEIIRREEIDCGWTRQDNYVYTLDSGRVKSFKNEAKTAARLGLPANFTKDTPLPFAVAAAVKFTAQAKFNAQVYVNGLAKAVNGGGSQVFENSRVISFSDGTPAIVGTKDFEVRATDVIVATNVPSFPLLARGAYCLLEYPTTSYIVVAKLEKTFPGMYISPDSGSYSILPIDDQLVLIGGENHIRGLGDKDKRWRKLADFAEEKLPVEAFSYKWSAWDYIAYDNIPLVGKMYPWSDHLFVATAFKKWGLTNTYVAASILRDLIVGESNDYSQTFRAMRSGPVKSIPDVMRQYLS